MSFLDNIGDTFSRGLDRYIDNRLPANNGGGASGTTVVRTGPAPTDPVKVAGTGTQALIAGVDNRLLYGSAAVFALLVVVMLVRR